MSCWPFALGMVRFICRYGTRARCWVWLGKARFLAFMTTRSFPRDIKEVTFFYPLLPTAAEVTRRACFACLSTISTDIKPSEHGTSMAKVYVLELSPYE